MHDKQMTLAVAAWIAVLVTLLIIVITPVRPARSEITFCSHHYGSVTNRRDRTDWVYRYVDGQKCWFPANGLRRGRYKPLEELKWPDAPTTPAMTIMEKEPSFEYRWTDPTGWSHKE